MKTGYGALLMEASLKGFHPLVISNPRGSRAVLEKVCFASPSIHADERERDKRRYVWMCGVASSIEERLRAWMQCSMLSYSRHEALASRLESEILSKRQGEVRRAPLLLCSLWYVGLACIFAYWACIRPHRHAARPLMKPLSIVVDPRCITHQSSLQPNMYGENHKNNYIFYAAMHSSPTEGWLDADEGTLLSTYLLSY